MRTLMLTSAALLIGTAFAGENGHKFGKDHPVVKLKPGHWLEVPDSHLEKVAFKWPAKGVGHRIGHVRGVMLCWCGGAYDTKRDRLIIWGGGHAGYAGNEIYVFDVPKLKWERINDPSLKLDNERGETYKDGKPRSVHTYDYIEYIPSIDRFVSLGLYATYPSGVGGGHTTWQFDFEKKKWETKSARKFPMTVNFCTAASAFDPVTEHEFTNTRNGTVREWDPLADKWTQRGRGAGYGWLAMGAVDPVGRRYLSIGRAFTRFGKPLVAQFYSADISGQGMVKREKIASKGPQEIPKGNAPGLEYDPVLDKVVGWDGGADLFLLDLEKMEWKKVESAATSKVTPTAAVKAGTYGRFRYIPSLNAYIVVNGTNQNVYIYRLTDRAKQPIPRRFVKALKSKDAKLVKWVAGQVALWPKKTAEPVLKAALKDQATNREVSALLQAALKKLEGK